MNWQRLMLQGRQAGSGPCAAACLGDMAVRSVPQKVPLDRVMWC
jgi:hypothetical protein